MNEGVANRCLQCIGTAWPGQSEGHCSANMRRIERGPNFRIAFGRTETHHNIFRAEDGVKPRLHESGEIECGKGAFAYDHRMDEFDGYMLRIS